MEDAEEQPIPFDAEEHRDELFAWFQTLALSTPLDSILDLANGNAFVEALLLLDGRYFRDVEEWTSAKVSALNELQEWMVTYIETKQTLVTSQFRKAVCDFTERFQAEFEQNSFNSVVGRLLQLVLVCAVLCPNKEEYINRMRDLPSLVAVGISEAILQLLPVQRHSDAVDSGQNDSNAQNGETWCTNCSALETEISQLVAERKQLRDVNAKLHTKLDAVLEVNNENSPLNKRIELLQKETNVLKDSVSRMESSRDEYRVKCNELQSQLGASVIDSEQLKRKVTDMDSLTDELDEWKQTVTQLRKYETEAKLYKKKLDEAGDLRNQVKLAETRNVELMKQNMELRQESEALTSIQNELGNQAVALEMSDEELKLGARRYENAEIEINTLRKQLAELVRRNKGMEVEKNGLTNGGIDDFSVQQIPLQQSLSFELGPDTFKEALLRRDLELADLSQKLTAQDKQIEELRKAGTQVSTPPQSFESEPTSSGSKDKETGIHADNLQNDIRIHSLQTELDDLRKLYTQQQKLMTAAWYRTTLRLEQQTFPSRLAKAAIMNRPTSFLEEQRKATNSPVVVGPRTHNGAQAATSRPVPKSFLR